MINSMEDGGERGTPISFSPVTSTKIGINPKNLLTFSFNPLTTMVKIFKAIPSASPKLLNLKQENWGYDNFFYIYARVTNFWSHGQMYNVIWFTW